MCYLQNQNNVQSFAHAALRLSIQKGEVLGSATFDAVSVVLQQASGKVDSATLTADGVKDTGAGLEDLMAQLDALSSR